MFKNKILKNFLTASNDRFDRFSLGLFITDTNFSEWLHAQLI